MRIVVRRQRTVVLEYSPGPFRPGKTVLFSDNLIWQSVNNNTVTGSAGTHSGTNRVLWVAAADDGVYPKDVLVQEYEATFALPAVDAGGTHLDAGQVTVRGVFLLSGTNWHPRRSTRSGSRSLGDRRVPPRPWIRHRGRRGPHPRD
jgi:hypothetical protein